jgi:hypothetical protein
MGVPTNVISQLNENARTEIWIRVPRPSPSRISHGIENPQQSALF